MKKVNIFSVFLFNPFRRPSKKYLLFLFMTMAILLCYGFLFTNKVHAEEEVIIPTEVLEVTEVSEVSTTIIMEEIVTPTEVSSDIETDTIWTKEGSPYIINASIYVYENVTLTIDKGVVVKFVDSDPYNNYNRGYSIDIAGKLVANGTTEEPIYFTSNFDDELGGSTDEHREDCNFESYDEEGNGIGEEICGLIDQYDPSAGNWDDLSFDSPEESVLNNIYIRYAGSGITLESSKISFENLNIKDSLMGFTGYNDSTAKINGGNFENLGDAFTIFNNSSLVVNGITLKNVNTGFTGFTGTGYYDDHPEVIPYSNNYLTVTDSTIDCTKDGITIFNEYSLNMKGGSISCPGAGITLFEEVKADIDGVKILVVPSTNDGWYDRAGIVAFNNTKPDTILIKNSDITGGEYGLLVWDSTFSAHRNNIHDNTIKGVDTYDSDISNNLDFTSNFWGDKSGPKNETSNPTGLGNEVADNILFKPFLKYDPLKERKDPIIIVPGIMGTELIRDYGDKNEIWPAVSKVIFSLFDNYLKELSLLQSGEENPDFFMIKGDIIRDIPTTDIFNGIVSELENNGGYKEGGDLFVFPYDWRFSNTKNAELLKEKIDQVLIDTEKDKVDIIAHSMGGLLTKEYIKENGKDKIDHLIFLGTPHLGAPKAYKALVYGDNMSFEKFYIPFLSSNIVKVISQNMPSIYELLPSRKYVDGIRYISEKTIGSDPAYLDYNATKNLLIEKNINQPMLESADTFHQGIDELDLSGIKVSNFSACGEATLSAINIRKEASVGPIKLKEDYKLKYANGDSTVPLDSSFGIDNVSKYFVDKISHSALPSAPDVPNAVLNILEDKAPQAESKVFEDVNKCTPIHGYIISIHSPITLDIYDTNGNHSGLDLDGNIENNIEGVSYDTIGDAKFAFIPDGLSVNVKGSATGSGTFDLAIEKVVNGETTETKFWNDLPITSTSKMNFDFSSYDNTNSIEIDNNGNKKSVSNSNTLLQNEDYFAVPAKIIETKSKNISGSYIKNNPKLVPNIPSTTIKQVIPPDIKKVNVEKQSIIKKPLAKLIEKKVAINKGTIVSVANLGASVMNTGQDIDFWGTIRAFFRRLFHIKK